MIIKNARIFFYRKDIVIFVHGHNGNTIRASRPRGCGNYERLIWLMLLFKRNWISIGTCLWMWFIFHLGWLGSMVYFACPVISQSNYDYSELIRINFYISQEGLKCDLEIDFNEYCKNAQLDCQLALNLARVQIRNALFRSFGPLFFLA